MQPSHRVESSIQSHSDSDSHSGRTPFAGVFGREGGKSLSRWAAPAAVVYAALLLTSCLEPADQILQRYGQSAIVFVKEASVGTANDNVAMASNTNEFYPGTDLCLLSPVSPTGTLTNLTEQWTRAAQNQNDWGAAQDPEVSFDGTKILFSMRRPRTNNERNQPWSIYEMNADGTNLVRLTSPDIGDNWDDVDPAYIDDNHIVFGSTRNHILDEYERRSVTQLFTGERGPNGVLVNVRQITFNQSHDQNPFIHSSGNIYFTRWDHLGNPNKMPLFTVHPDGTRQFVLYGADETFGTGMTSGSRTFMEARELQDGGLVSSIMERTSRFEGGAIAIIDLAKFTSAPQIITPGASPYNNTQVKSDAVYKTPYPIMDGTKERILVAMSPHPVGPKTDPYSNYDLFVMDKDGGNMTLVYADSKYNNYDPVVVAPRTLPVKPFTVDTLVQAARAAGAKTGIFFDADVYSRQDNDGHMSSQELLNGQTDRSKDLAKFVRVIQAIPLKPNYQGMSNLGHTEFEKQKVIGYGDVRPDGSLSIEVPANLAMHIQTLDSNGMMLVNQLQWINVMPGEQRMCTGCHGVREKDQDITHFHNTNGEVTFDLADVKHYLSSFNNAQKVTEHPAVRSDTLDFMNLSYPAKTATIQNLFDRRCNSCHGASVAKDSGGGLVLENRLDTALNNHGTASVYETLTSQGSYAKADNKTNTRDQRYVSTEGARVSPLAWVMLNKQLSQTNQKLFRTPAYDHTALWSKDSTGKVDPFAKANADLLSLIEWMDMGTQFTNSVGAPAKN